MARKRNSERLEAPTPEDTSVAAPVAATTHDIFSFVTPTEFVELPSKGQFYEEGSSLAGVTEVEIRHMTAK